MSMTAVHIELSDTDDIHEAIQNTMLLLASVLWDDLREHRVNPGNPRTIPARIAMLRCAIDQVEHLYSMDAPDPVMPTERIST